MGKDFALDLAFDQRGMWCEDYDGIQSGGRPRWTIGSSLVVPLSVEIWTWTGSRAHRRSSAAIHIAYQHPKKYRPNPNLDRLYFAQIALNSFHMLSEIEPSVSDCTIADGLSVSAWYASPV